MEFYIVTNSFAAPFFSDSGSQYVEAECAEAALNQVANTYSHPAGLYSAAAYSSADAKNKGEKALAQWWCNHEIQKQAATEGKSAFSFLGHAPGDFEVDGKRYTIPNPKSGMVIR